MVLVHFLYLYLRWQLYYCIILLCIIYLLWLFYLTFVVNNFNIWISLVYLILVWFQHQTLCSHVITCIIVFLWNVHEHFIQIRWKERFESRNTGDLCGTFCGCIVSHSFSTSTPRESNHWCWSKDLQAVIKNLLLIMSFYFCTLFSRHTVSPALKNHFM